MADTKIGFELSKAKAAVLEMTILMAVGSKCPYCGIQMTRKDLDTAITSDVDALPFHEACWKAHAAKS